MKRQCMMWEGRYITLTTDEGDDARLHDITAENVGDWPPSMLDAEDKDNFMKYYGDVDDEVTVGDETTGSAVVIPKKDIVWVDMDFTDQIMRIFKGIPNPAAKWNLLTVSDPYWACELAEDCGDEYRTIAKFRKTEEAETVLAALKGAQ